MKGLFPFYDSPEGSHTEHECLFGTNEGTLAPLLAPDAPYEDKQREEMGFTGNAEVSDSSRLIKVALK